MRPKDKRPTIPPAGRLTVRVYNVAEFLDWALGPGQAFAPDLSYAPLPAKVIELARGKVRAIKSDGKALIAAN